MNKYKYMDSLFLEETKLLDNRKVFSTDGLSVMKVTKGVVLSTKVVDGVKRAGVNDSKGEYIDISAFEALSPVDSWFGGYDTSNEKYIDERVLYFGRYWKHWGHFLMDLVPRLWYVLENEPDIKIAYDSDVEISGVYLEFLRLLGVNREQLIQVGEPTRFKEVVVAEAAHKPGISCNKRYKDIFDRVAENALREFDNPEKYMDKKIYFTRTGIKKKIPLEVGEKQIEQIFANNDYMIISPEKHSLVEQIVMVRLAKEICCVSGTLPHNMVFAKDGANLTIIRKSNKPVYRQWDVNEMRKLKVTSVDAHISLFPVGAGGPFILDINKNLRKYFKDKKFKFRYNAVAQFFKRKGKLIWYLPVFVVRNRGKNNQVPLFDGKEFSTRKSAKRELFWYYFKRI